MEQCCGTCKFHEYDKAWDDWECSNLDSEDCGGYTPYNHCCDEYEERSNTVSTQEERHIVQEPHENR